MSWRGSLARSVKEVRFCLCPTGEASEGARAFVAKNYGEIKKLNPSLPFLVREATGIKPYMLAELGMGKRDRVELDGLSEQDIESSLQRLAEGPA